MDRRAHGQHWILQHQLLGEIDRLAPDWEHFIDHPKQRVKGVLHVAASFERVTGEVERGYRGPTEGSGY